MKCPACGSHETSKVLYAAIPARFCLDCRALWGFWSLLVALLPFDGWFYFYTCSYPKALWGWLRSEPNA